MTYIIILLSGILIGYILGALAKSRDNKIEKAQWEIMERSYLREIATYKEMAEYIISSEAERNKDTTVTVYTAIEKITEYDNTYSSPEYGC